MVTIRRILLDLQIQGYCGPYTLFHRLMALNEVKSFEGIEWRTSEGDQTDVRTKISQGAFQIGQIPFWRKSPKIESSTNKKKAGQRRCTVPPSVPSAEATTTYSTL